MLPKTRFSHPWALIRRRSGRAGHGPVTRMAYLIDTMSQNGLPVALSGYLMRDNFTGWSKYPHRIHRNSVIWCWRRQPSGEAVHLAKASLAEAEATIGKIDLIGNFPISASSRG